MAFRMDGFQYSVASLGSLTVIRKPIPPILVPSRTRGSAESRRHRLSAARRRCSTSRCPGSVGDIGDLIGVAAQIVELLAGTLGCRQFEVFRDRRVRSSIQEQRLRRPAIDIPERADGEILLGIACRPAFGAQVANVQVVVRANRSDRVAEVTAPHVGVALSLDEHASRADCDPPRSSGRRERPVIDAGTGLPSPSPRAASAQRR